MNTLHNSIALRNKKSVVLEPSTGSVAPNYIRGLLLEISQLGYTLGGDVLTVLETQTNENFIEFRDFLIEELRNMVGANVKYVPLFKKFPDDIPDDDEYFTKRVVGFLTNQFDLVPEDIAPLSCGHVIDTRLFNMDDFGACPICQMQVDETTSESNRPALEDVTPLKIIGLTDTAGVYSIFTNLLAAKSSISEDNQNVVTSLVKNDNMIAFIPDAIPMKENLALIAGLLIQFTDDADVVLSKHFKTATDVLRLAVQLSGGDVSLAAKTRFKLKNKERRVIMALLDNVKNAEEDMIRYRMEWVRLGEVLHIGSKKKKYPNAFAAINTIRNEADSVKTFGSKVEALVLEVKNGENTGVDLVNLLATRPGEFGRRLDFLVRHIDTDIVMGSFANLVVQKLPTPMLLTISAHFKSRAEKSTLRYFIPKGKLAKIQAVEDNRDTIKQEIVDSVLTVITVELEDRFSKLESLGNVYLDPALKNYVLPMTQRSATSSLETITRGSRVSIPDTKTIRMFMYWKDVEGDVDTSGWGNPRTVDVDLSAVAYTSDWDYKFHLSYTNLSSVGGKHSGDIQSAPNGASEFIDIDINKALSKGVRYIVMNVISYTGQPFNTFECFAGVMGREKAGSGEVYEPKTVTQRFDVAGDTRYNIPLIFDLETMQFIWADFALTSGPRFENVESKSNKLVLMAKVAESILDTKPVMFDLFDMHAQARADSVDYERDPDKDYDLVLDESTATQIDDILANWM